METCVACSVAYESLQDHSKDECDAAVVARVMEVLCDSCGEPGSECNDPFDEEIHDTIVPVTLCAKCYQDRSDDI